MGWYRDVWKFHEYNLKFKLVSFLYFIAATMQGTANTKATFTILVPVEPNNTLVCELNLLLDESTKVT